MGTTNRTETITLIERLADGSQVTVTRTGHNLSLIDRKVDGVMVWGQAFSCGGSAEDHKAQTDRVVADMRTRPADFTR